MDPPGTKVTVPTTRLVGSPVKGIPLIVYTDKGTTVALATAVV